jgi:hypothetical protein
VDVYLMKPLGASNPPEVHNCPTLLYSAWKRCESNFCAILCALNIK